MISKVNLQINEKLYLKDPLSSELGKRIISAGIDMINELGFEQFTFRKLAQVIGSTEASVYRYFESKYKLLLYLTSWYWAWIEYKLAFAMANIGDPETRLMKAIRIVTESVNKDGDFVHINEVKLNRIVISESSKAYLTKDVDAVNKEGAFANYKQVVSRLSEVILEINPSYKYPHMLVSTIIEGAHHERFFAEHLPRLTDTVNGEDSVCEFYKDMVIKMIK